MIHKLKQKIKRWHIILFVVLIVVFIALFANKTSNNETEEKRVRQAVFAGSWYPGDKETLTKTVNEYLANAKQEEINGEIKALIVPHAGYVYSGQVAAQGFNQLENDYKKVFIIGTNHAQGANVNGISIPDVTHYKTPLGEVKVSKIAKELSEEELFVNVPLSHTTHIIEIELPFLQEKLTDFEIIPLVTGALNYQQIQQAASLISKYLDEETLIVISSDLSHYQPYDTAVNLDTTCINNIESLNLEESSKCQACGLYAIFILMKLAKDNGWQAEIIDYKNSGDTAGSKDSVVGYSSIVFHKEEQEELTGEEKEVLLNLARETVDLYVKEGRIPEVNEEGLSPKLTKVQGCFTTLNKDRNLRGCIGHILPQEELYKCVMDNAINAAVNDRRFKPVTKEELEDINIEVSVLSVPQKIEFSSGDNLKNKLRPMIDGVVIKQGFYQSTYLPQVWANFNNDKEQFLTSLCRKGGMSENCWQDTSTEVFTYQAFVFEED
ncbi:MAG: AmmeMemoRadiSam system protein B [Nanoarchaeota archaeon]|nr:AmmeMemoRadiSam system protein B [Nanoarchaeota archaeon]